MDVSTAPLGPRDSQDRLDVRDRKDIPVPEDSPAIRVVTETPERPASRASLAPSAQLAKLDCPARRDAMRSNRLDAKDREDPVARKDPPAQRATRAWTRRRERLDPKARQEAPGPRELRDRLDRPATRATMGAPDRMQSTARARTARTAAREPAAALADVAEEPAELLTDARHKCRRMRNSI